VREQHLEQIGAQRDRSAVVVERLNLPGAERPGGWC
jgi:hypothetical protein